MIEKADYGGGSGGEKVVAAAVRGEEWPGLMREIGPSPIQVTSCGCACQKRWC